MMTSDYEWGDEPFDIDNRKKARAEREERDRIWRHQNVLGPVEGLSVGRALLERLLEEVRVEKNVLRDVVSEFRHSNEILTVREAEGMMSALDRAVEACARRMTLSDQTLLADLHLALRRAIVDHQKKLEAGNG
jgi:hypothetical protein